MSLNSWINFKNFADKIPFFSQQTSIRSFVQKKFLLNNKQAKEDLSNHRRISVWVNQPAYKCKHFHGMSSSESYTKIYSFQIKFGVFHQKVTLTTSEQNLSMKTLRVVAIRFIQTVVIVSFLFVYLFASLPCISSVRIKTPDCFTIEFYSIDTNRYRIRCWFR